MVPSTVIVLLVVTSSSYAYPQPLSFLPFALRGDPPLKPLPLNFDDNIEPVVDGMQNGVGETEAIFKKVKGMTEALDGFIKEADAKIASLVQEIGITASEKVALTKEALNLYHEVKTEILATRNELRELATQTVQSCESLSIFMEGWGEEVDVEEKRAYLGVQLEIMKDLLAESKIKLTAAKASYKKSIEKMGRIRTNIDIFKKNINNMLAAESKEHKAWTKKLRGGIYGGALGPLALSMLLADFMGCSGFCTGTITSSAAAGAIAGVEEAIKKFTEKLEELAENVQEATDNVNQVSSSIEHMEGFLKEETKVLTNWLASVKSMNTAIKIASPDRFVKLPLLRTNFSNSLTNLQKAAQAFLDGPVLSSNEIEDEKRRQVEGGRAKEDKKAIDAILQQRKK